MKSSASYSVAIALLCIATLAAVQDAQPLAQQDLKALREYLLKQEEQTQPEIEPEQRGIADDLANADFADIPEDVNEVERQVDDPSLGGYNEAERQGDEPPLSGYSEVERQVDDPSLGGYNEVERQVDDPPLSGYNEVERQIDDPSLGGYNEAERQVDDPPLSGYSEVERQVDDPSLGGYNEVERQVDDPPLGEYNVRLAEDGESFLLQEERSAKDDGKKDNASGARDKSGNKQPSFKKPVNKYKGFLELKVIKAEKYQFGGNGPFYDEIGVVITLENDNRLYIRQSSRCWSRWRNDCRNVRIRPASSMTKNWERLASSEPKESTLSDFIEAAKTASNTNTAADAMMKLP